MKLHEKVAIVTGAGSGIGRAIALAFAKQGANVVVADIDFQSAQNVADEIKSLGSQAQAIKVDVSNSEEVNQCVRKSIDRFKKIDVLVNNAGIAKIALSEELSEDDWDRIIDVNLKGQFLFSQAVGRQMIQQKQGKIINIASTAAHSVFLRDAGYGASKAGVIQLTKVLAVEWGQYNINVNSVSPGQTRTGLSETIEKLAEGFPTWEEREKTIPLKRANKPEDIASVVLFLASSEADNISGQDIIVDGGIGALHPTSASVVQRQSKQS